MKVTISTNLHVILIAAGNVKEVTFETGLDGKLSVLLAQYCL
jgi:hypothetical protein